MKKSICLLMTMLFAAVTNICVFASTSVSIESAQQAETGEIDVNCSIEEANTSQVITVISCEYDDTTYSSTVIYTDQFTADITSENTFTFNFLPALWTDTDGTYIVRVGGYGIDEPTAMIISFYNGVIYKTGDINGDGSIDESDATLLLKYLSEITSLTSSQLEAGDYNEDEQVNLIDVIGILQSQSE